MQTSYNFSNLKTINICLPKISDGCKMSQWTENCLFKFFKIYYLFISALIKANKFSLSKFKNCPQLNFKCCLHINKEIKLFQNKCPGISRTLLQLILWFWIVKLKIPWTWWTSQTSQRSNVLELLVTNGRKRSWNVNANGQEWWTFVRLDV